MEGFGFDFGSMFGNEYDYDDPYGLKGLQVQSQAQAPNPVAGLLDNSSMYNLYNQFGGQNPAQLMQGDYYNPESSSVKAYEELASTPPESEKLLADYAASKPTEEGNRAGFGRKLAAALIGAASSFGPGGPGLANANMRTVLDAKYNTAMDKWKGEGTNISTRARLADADRSRKLGAFKFGIQNEVNAGRQKTSDEYKRSQEARRLADEIATEKALGESRKFNQNMSENLFEQRKSMDDWRKQEALTDNTRADNENKLRHELQAAKSQSYDQINKDINAFASQQGIDTSEYGSAQAVAYELAAKKAKAHPAFGDLMQELTDENEITENGGNKWKILTPEYGADRVRILNNYIKSLMTKYLRGEFK
jgi:hypothetical protein